jgi:YHS domain-containing protein
VLADLDESNARCGSNSFERSICIRSGSNGEKDALSIGREPLSLDAVAAWINHLRENAMSRDPVCGVLIDEKLSSWLKYEGRKYYFCSDACRKHFHEIPEKYLLIKAA